MSLRILQLNSARLYVGEAAHTLNLTEALRRAGHTVVLGLREGHQTIEYARTRGLDPVPFHFASRWHPTRDLGDLKRLAALVREHDIQLIHVHRGKEHWAAIFARKLHALKVPVVRTRHLTRPLKNHLANRWLAKRTARMIVVSRAVEADVRGSELYSEAHVAFIPGGIDLERFRARGRREAERERLGLPPGAPVAICVARLAQVKAHGILLDAWARVLPKHPGAVLVLAGFGVLWADLKARVEREGFGTSVRMLGRVGADTVPGLLEAADVGVLASTGSEGFSRAVLEYMALGLPVVATTVGAIPDLVAPGVSGKLAPPGDAGALAAALDETFAADAAKREAWGRAGRERAEADYGFAAWAAAHERLYRDVLDEPAV
ncbi:MAG: glycosyltransferase family 4 protein [Planctomycetota bacterium]|nr:glycosyltransferase family 4 protein [Planctomycetota bacterium]